MTTTERFLEMLSEGGVRFRERPAPVAGDSRIAWGLAALVAILATSWGKRASYPKLHMLGHAMRRSDLRLVLEHTLLGATPSSAVAVRVEPWLNRAIAFAAALKLVSVTGGKAVKLADRGQVAFDDLRKRGGILTEELLFLERVRRLATEQAVLRIMKMED